MSALKRWQFAQDNVLKRLSIGILERKLFKIQLREKAFTKNEVKIGSIEATAVESAGTFNKDSDGETRLTTGFGFCFGKNETKAISISIIDLTLYNDSYTVGTEQIIASDFEMMMHHVDGIESFGFANHYKLPHYVTFQTDYQVFKNASKYVKEEDTKGVKK